MLIDFPKIHGDDRENKILDVIKNEQNRVFFNWVPLEINYKKHKAIFFVMNDALKIDNIRINVNAKTEQKIADFLGASLLTSKIADHIWHNASIRINPFPRKISSTTKSMIEHSFDIDNILKIFNIKDKLISTVGKHWILDNAILYKKNMCNYGWWFDTGSSYKGIKGNINSSLLKNPKTKSYWHMIQSKGFHHSDEHTDYSQICRLVTRECIINDKKMDIVDLFKDPELSYLANNDGILNITRIASVKSSEDVVII